MKNKIKSLLLFLLILLTLAGCNSSETLKTKREGEPDIFSVEGDDTEMNAAIKKANQTLGQFNQALKSSNPSFYSFALKTRFNTNDGGGEHIWVSDISVTNDQYFGVVDNLPESTTDVKIGDTVQISPQNISDWMYIEDQKLRGGYTIRVLRDRMTEEERKQFDENYGLIIE